jgi:cell division protein FtsB
MRKAAFLVTVVALLLIINGLIGSIFDLLSKQDLVVDAQKKLEQEKARNNKLKAEFELAQRKEFVEEQARNKLFWTKDDEQNVIIPSNLIPQDIAPKVANRDPYWKQWLDLFF